MHSEDEVQFASIEEATAKVNQLLSQNKQLLQDNKALQDQADDQISAQMCRQNSETIKEMASAISDAFIHSKAKSKDHSLPEPLAIPESLQALQPVQKTDNYGPPISQDICDALSQSWHRVFHKERPQNATMLKPLEIGLRSTNYQG